MDILFPNSWPDTYPKVRPLPVPVVPWPAAAPAQFLPGFTTTLKPFTGWLTDMDVERVVSAVVKRLVEMHATATADVAVAVSPVPKPETAPKIETAWLIETAWVIEDQWPALSPLHSPVTMFWAGWDESSSPPRLLRWSDDTSHAMRFARRRDAEIAAKGLGKGVAVEHVWVLA